MDILISFIAPIIACIVIYKLFDRFGFKEALIFRIIYTMIILWIGGTLGIMYDYSITLLIVYLVMVLVVCIIVNALDNWIFKSTSSFISFIIISAILGSILNTIIQPWLIKIIEMFI